MSENLSLRVFEKTDLDFLHRLFNDSNIMDYWFKEAHYSKVTLEADFEKQIKDSATKSFILQDGDQDVGLVELLLIDNIHRKAEFAIMIDPRQQGKGYALKATNLAIEYAFLTLNLNKLYLYVDVINEKAIHIYEKAGFTQEAVLKDEFFVNGEYHDIAYMSCFQKDYLNKKNSRV